MPSNLGKEMHQLAQRLWPLSRSVSSDANFETLQILSEVNQDLQIREFAAQSTVFDWTVPESWNLREAWIKAPNGDVLIHTQDSNLHVLGFSTPINQLISFDDLKAHLFQDADPQAIPYVTSYYSKNWGFCVTAEQYQEIEKHQTLQVSIQLSPPKNPNMAYGEIFIQGETEAEILISTYICHPSMANNELSGPIVAIYLARYIKNLNNYYSYRFVFVSETIGAIAYIAKKTSQLRKVIAGYVLTCIGDERNYSYLQTQTGTELSDQFFHQSQQNSKRDIHTYSFLDRGSDERQYNSHPLNLGIGGISRTIYGKYAEYHTSKDDLKLVTPTGLQGGYEYIKEVLDYIETQRVYAPVHQCEPMLGKRGLYSNISFKGSQNQYMLLLDILAYSDGQRSTQQIANMTNLDHEEVLQSIKLLCEADLLRSI